MCVGARVSWNVGGGFFRLGYNVFGWLFRQPAVVQSVFVVIDEHGGYVYNEQPNELVDKK